VFYLVFAFQLLFFFAFLDNSFDSFWVLIIFVRIEVGVLFVVIINVTVNVIGMTRFTSHRLGLLRFNNIVIIRLILFLVFFILMNIILIIVVQI